jgi:hypothetical protein
MGWPNYVGWAHLDWVKIRPKQKIRPRSAQNKGWADVSPTSFVLRENWDRPGLTILVRADTGPA